MGVSDIVTSIYLERSDDGHCLYRTCRCHGASVFLYHVTAKRKKEKYDRSRQVDRPMQREKSN